MDRTKLLKKIQALLALSKSDNQHEAELAAEKASELMAQHQIAVSELDVKLHFGSGDIIEEFYAVDGLKMKLKWVETLAYACARGFDATVVANTVLHGTSFRWVGFPEDVGAAKAMFEHLYLAWQSIVVQDLNKAKAQKMSPGKPWLTWSPKDTMQFKQGHGLAYANVLYCRFIELVAARKAQVTATGTALVVVKDAALSDYSKAKGWRAAKQKVSSGSQLGRVAGRAAGDAVHIGKNIGSSAKRLAAGG